MCRILVVILLALCCVSEAYAFNLASGYRVRAYEGDFDNLGSVEDVTDREKRADQVKGLKRTELGYRLSNRLSDSLVRRLYIGSSTYVGHKMAMINVDGDLVVEIEKLIRMLDVKKETEHRYNTSVKICPEAYDLLDKVSDIDGEALRSVLRDYRGSSRVYICDVAKNNDRDIQISLTKGPFMKPPAVAGVSTDGEDKAAGLVVPE